MSIIEYEVPTWSQISDMLLSQAQKILSIPFKPDIIVGISRGGIIPSRIMIDLLGTPRLAFLQIEFYVDIGQSKLQPRLKEALTTKITGQNVLLIDDIADSGKSLKLAKDHLQQQGPREIKTATLYRKPQSIIIPDFYEKQTSNWVVFPWETKETLRKILQSSKGKRAPNQEVAKLVKAGLPKQIAERLLADLLKELKNALSY
ncbi:MAG: phosphoribosyltransferase [Candidatus Bathyarchaeota archaeon]|nr:phosphoribosyltransferase [Candidatus Bathyarchaeota archaeon]